ncbi:exonuclease domain-containing protein [Cupriavidus sp. H39]|uniref:exonuclease domain-containing protein n=1 Tax=Cupriavidus sp. H39 TaxID=3401635 RepID=UPI003D040C2F
MRVAIVSTETTGLTPEDEPVSIGLLLVEVSPRAGGLLREVAEYYGSQEPTVPISAAATDTHGLTADMLRGRRFDIGAIRAIVDDADVLVAHGAAFNARMLEKVLPGIRDKPWRCSVRQVHWSRYFHAANHKLDTLCEHLHIFRPRPQVALDDCLALSKLLFRQIGASREATPMGFLLAEADFATSAAARPCSAPAPLAASARQEAASSWMPQVEASQHGPGRGLVMAAVILMLFAGAVIWPDLFPW